MKDDRRTDAKKSSFLTWEVSPEFYREGRIGDRLGAPGRKERQNRETKWIRIKDRREG